ncbi:hypothetical protein ACIOJ4_49900, partial [Streptomyces chartreusis]
MLLTNQGDGSSTFARVYGALPAGSPSLKVTHTYIPVLNEGAGSYKEVQPPWLVPGAPLPFFVVAEGSHDHVMVRRPGADDRNMRLRPAEFAVLVAQDPVLAQSGAQTIVLLIPHAGAQDLELPRAVAAQTRSTVWAITGELLVTPNTGRMVANAAEESSLIVVPGRTGMLPANGWVRSAPEDLPRAMSSQAANELRYLVTPDGRLVFDNELSLYPIVGKDLRPIGGLSFTTEEWKVTGYHTSRILEYQEYRSIDLTDKRMSEPRRVPWADSAARPYVWVSHGYRAQGAAPGGVAMRDRAGNRVYVADKQFGLFLRRRRSVEKLPPESPIIVHACDFGAPSANVKAPGQEVANILQRVVYAPDRPLVSRSGPYMAGLFMDFGPNGEPGTWQRFTPEPQARSVPGSIGRGQWPWVSSASGPPRPASAASYRPPPPMPPYTPQVGSAPFSGPRQRRLSELGSGRPSWSPTQPGSWTGYGQSLDFDALRDALPRVWGGNRDDGPPVSALPVHGDDGTQWGVSFLDPPDARHSPVAEQPVEDGALAKMLGPDHFGLRKAPPAPDFLRGYDFSALHAAQRAAFFDAVDLTRPAPRG